MPRSIESEPYINDQFRRKITFSDFCSRYGINDPGLKKRLKDIADTVSRVNVDILPNASHNLVPQMVLMMAGQAKIINHEQLLIIKDVPNPIQDEILDDFDIVLGRIPKGYVLMESNTSSDLKWKYFWTNETINALTNWIDERYLESY